MHILAIKDETILDIINNIFESSILKDERKNNYFHLTINEDLYYQHKKWLNDLKKENFLKKIDIIQKYQYKPSIKFINITTGKEIEPFHKIFAIESIKKINIPHFSSMLLKNNAIALMFDPEMDNKIEEIKKIKNSYINYKLKKEEREKEYEKKLKEYEKLRNNYEKDLKEYREKKLKIEEWNKKEKELAKKENRKAVLKKINIEKPKAPEKPKKEKINMPNILDTFILREHLNNLLLGYLFEINKITEKLFLLKPLREIDSVFKREYLELIPDKIEKIDSENFFKLLKEKLKEERIILENNNNVNIFFNSSFSIGGSELFSFAGKSRYLNTKALTAFFEENPTVEEWEVLQNTEHSSKEQELPILTKLKPNQTAAMLAGGISFAKEIEINGEKLLIKGATVKTKSKRETIINNMIVEETIESYEQEIGVLNISRRSLEIIK